MIDDATNSQDGTEAAGMERRRRRTVANLAFGAIKAQHAAYRSPPERFVDRLNYITSSPPFLVVHAIWFGLWILWNTGVLGQRTFDPFPFGLLTMVVSLEAIVLSIFVLMTQNRESAIAELREEMTLEVDMRMEEEVTKTLQLVVGLYGRLGFSVGNDDDLREMLEPLDKSRIEQELATELNSVYRRNTRPQSSDAE